MTTEEKPLRVQVAEALGIKIWQHEDRSCSHCGYQDNLTPGCWWMDDGDYGSCQVLPYGEDSPEGWAATGPLLRRCRTDLYESTTEPPSWCAEALRPAERPLGAWAAGDLTVRGRGDSPCEAIARCVLALAAAGKLPR